ncbi:hypothetical protein MY10362_005365 [Beauveria mimosiformis]
MEVVDAGLRARVAQMLKQFKVVATTKPLSTPQKRLAIASILDEAVRQLERRITTAKKSRRSRSIKLEDLKDVKEESIENSGMQGIEATQTKASRTGLSSAAAAVVLAPGPNAVADSATHAQSYPGPINVILRDILAELVEQNTLLAALLKLPPQELKRLRQIS